MNERFEVLSVHDVDFVDQETNRPVIGMQLWLIRQTDEKAWNGWEVLKVWIPDGSKLEEVVVSLHRGDLIEIQWNRRGKPENISLVK